MARTTLTKTTAPGSYAGTSTAVTMGVSDLTNLNQFVLTGREVLIIQNVNAGAQTWTATSVDDPFGRSENIAAESIAAGAIRVFGPVALVGWLQTDGFFYLQGSHADVKFGVITLP